MSNKRYTRRGNYVVDTKTGDRIPLPNRAEAANLKWAMNPLPKRHRNSSTWLYVVLGILAALYALVQIVLPALGG